MGVGTTDAEHRQTIAAVLKYGSASAAARALGVARPTFQHRVNRARAAYPDALPEARFDNRGGWASEAAWKPPEYIAPELPDEDEPLEDVISRIAAERDRQRAYHEATEWMRFTVEGDDPFCLAFIGDPHADTCDIRLLQKHTELIESTDRMWAVGLGDWANQWVGRLQAKYGHQVATQKDAYRVVQWLFDKPIWWLILLGNHDGMRWHGYGSPLRWMENAAPVPVQDWQAKFSVGCGGRVWKIWAAHDFPGNSMWNPLHGPAKRAQQTGAMADLYICGDHHVYALGHTQHEHTGKEFWIARARGYKPLDDYALEKGFGEQTIGHSIGAVFDPRDGSLVCFADLDKASSYLNYLRKPRVRVKAA